MSIEKVQRYFDELGAKNRIIKFDTSSATVELAAEALGTKPERIAKSISFITPEGPVLIVTAGDAKIDNAKFKNFFNVKATMVKRENVESTIGYAAGGVCPFDVNENVKIYLDISLKRFETVFPAAGSHDSCVEVTLDELERYSGCNDWEDLCKGWID